MSEHPKSCGKYVIKANIEAAAVEQKDGRQRRVRVKDVNKTRKTQFVFATWRLKVGWESVGVRGRKERLIEGKQKQQKKKKHFSNCPSFMLFFPFSFSPLFTSFLQLFSHSLEERKRDNGNSKCCCCWR